MTFWLHLILLALLPMSGMKYAAYWAEPKKWFISPLLLGQSGKTVSY